MTRAVRFHSGLVIGVVLLGLLAATRAGARELGIVKPVTSCEGLAGTQLLLEGGIPLRIVSANQVPDEVTSPYCTVKGYVAPQVNFELRLPTNNWTQRLLFAGCGGFCGAVRIRAQAAEQCQPVQNGELAIVATDMGHSSGVADTVWAAGNQQARVDFGHRGVHVVEMAAKQIIATFYGQKARYAYFSGCSDGGREGMMEAQRYPTDFNGIIAGAPVINVTANNSLYHAWIVRHLLRPDGTKVFTDAQLALLHDAVLRSCGGSSPNDGLVLDPRTCRFDPTVLECQAAVGCLSSEQVQDVRELYTGAHGADGRPLYFGFPVGSELTWNAQAQGSRVFAENFISFLAGEPPQPSINLWDIAFSQESLDFYSRSGAVLNALDPNLDSYQSAGGKLLLWHGWADGGVPPQSTLTYVDSVRRLMGGAMSDSFLRLYMLPGVYHCGGGPGPDKVDLLTPLMAWVEDGNAPGSIEVSAKTYGRTLRKAQVKGQ